MPRSTDETIESSERNPDIYGQLIYKKSQEYTTGERTVSSVVLGNLDSRMQKNGMGSPSYTMG